MIVSTSADRPTPDRDPPGPITASTVGRRRAHHAERLRRAGVSPGQLVTVADTDPLDQLTGVLAALELGAVAVVSDPDWPPAVRRDAANAAAAVPMPRDEAGIVVFTSGTTGTPTPVARSLRSWTSAFPDLSALAGIRAADTVLIPGRLSASLFLFGAVHAVSAGASLHLLPRWNPALAAAAANACTVAHLVPTMLTELTDALRAATDTSVLRLALCAGAHLPESTEAAAAELGIDVVDYYGASELSFVAIRPPGAKRMHPFPGVEVAVRESLIHVRSPYLATNVERDADGFATVGDRGIRHADGSLTVLGRAEIVITSGGATVRAEGVEEVLRTAPETAEVAVLGRPHRVLGQVVAAVVEPRDGTTPRLSSLRGAAAAGLRPSDRPRLWYVIDRLPRTRTGKVARAELAAALDTGAGVRRLA